MKSFFNRRLSEFCLRMVAIVVLGPLGNSFGQGLQREWVRTYSNVPTKGSRATAIALAPDGNVVVAGSSQSTAGDWDYLAIKYAPNGGELWRVRFDYVDLQFDDELRGMAIDPNGNIILTGTSVTVKYDKNGVLKWVVPLGGRAIISNSQYVYVTGFSDVDFATAQLENNDTDGKEIWRQFVDSRFHGPDIAGAIALDLAGNIYVGGQYEDYPCRRGDCGRAFGVVSYSPNGMQRWFANTVGWAQNGDASSLVVLDDGSVVVYGSFATVTGEIAKYDASGSFVWGGHVDGESGTKLLKSSAKVFMTGRYRSDDQAFVDEFPMNGTTLTHTWSYLGPNGGWSEGNDLRQDSKGNLYIAGYSANDSQTATTALLSAMIDNSGRQLGVDRYNGPNGSSSYGMAICIDANDNAYVAGYTRNSDGSSEFVTIKYSAAPAIEKKLDGTMQVEFRTLPNQFYAIEGSADFLSWESLMTNTADGNGVARFLDTNAVGMPKRFYRGKKP